MDPREARLSLAVLVAGAALVLGAGGAWWKAAAPDLEASPVPTSPPVVVAPDPVVPEPDPAPNGLDSYLPQVDRTIERLVGRIVAEQGYTMLVDTDKDDDYMLQYVCVGPGRLVVRITGTSEGEKLYDVDCGGNLSTFEFLASGTEVIVEVIREDPEPVDIGVQVVDVR